MSYLLVLRDPSASWLRCVSPLGSRFEMRRRLHTTRKFKRGHKALSACDTCLFTSLVAERERIYGRKVDKNIIAPQMSARHKNKWSRETKLC